MQHLSLIHIYLKYLESFEIQSNSNNQTRIVSLGEEICELKYLKSLTVFALSLIHI